MSSLFGGLVSSLSAPATNSPAPAAQAGKSASPAVTTTQPAADVNSLIAEAARDLSDYQRLTSEGKLGEAGQKLEELKRVLDKLNGQRR
jgi:hypothetical protein